MSARRMVLVAVSAATSLGLSAGFANAADDGYKDVFSSVLTAVGVLNPDVTPDIDYRERPPLVLPPKMTLEKPVPEGAGKTAAWPQDPDVIAARKAAAAARAPMANILGNPDLKSSHDEQMRGRIAGTDSADIPESALRHDRCGNNGNGKNCLVVSPDELKAMNDRYQASGLAEKKDIVAGEEPERVYLTQPPKGYLKVTKTVKATTEAPKPKLDELRPSSALVYKEHTDD